MTEPDTAAHCAGHAVYDETCGQCRVTVYTEARDQALATAALEAEMRRLERRMYELDWHDPERVKVVRQYDAVCDKLGVPSGDK